MLFDLDGTLLDTSPGIIHSYKKTAEKFGYDISHITSYMNIIGGALPDNFVKYFKAKQEDIHGMVTYYREVYAKEGIKLAIHYDGVKEALEELKANGIKTAVATLKREDFAKEMMDDFGFGNLFDYIAGMDVDDTKTKADIINECLNVFKAEKKQAVMIGDTQGDLNAAKECGVNFIGVSYGFGFDEGNDKECCKNLSDIVELVRLIE
ncbi:MAG: HAD hydrolase-like protein [Bacillota bacterium]